MSRSRYRPRNRFKGWEPRPRHEVTAQGFETWYERRPWRAYPEPHGGELILTDHRHRHPPRTRNYIDRLLYKFAVQSRVHEADCTGLV